MKLQRLTNDPVYDFITWCWQNIPVLSAFEDQAKAIITYMFFQVFLVLLALFILAGL